MAPAADNAILTHVHDGDADGYLAPHCSIDGLATSSFWQPTGTDMWIVVAKVRAGAIVRWQSEHGDEGLYVRTGAVTHGAEGFEGGGVVIVESGVATTITFESDAEVIHHGTTTPTPYGDGMLGLPFPDGHGVHIVPERYGQVIQHPPERGTWSVYYADGVCRTCRLAIFRNGGTKELAAPSHYHTEDEIIHVLGGTMRVGQLSAPAGTSVFIRGEKRYSFRTDGAFEFLNYRRGLSVYTGRPGTPEITETWHHPRAVSFASPST